MAKKVAEENAVEDFTERVCKEIVADYGDVILSSDKVVNRELKVIPIGPALDMICGGIREGSWVSIGGQPKTTKTNLALQFAANCQRPENGSRPVYYARVEGRLNEAHFKGIKGLDIKKLMVIQSTEDKILTAQDYLRIFAKILKTVKNAVLIIDSISALVDEREMEGGVGTETRGSGAKVTSQWISTMSNVVPVMNSIVIGITHLYANTSGMGAKWLEKGSGRFKYQADYIFRTIKKENWPPTGKQVGIKTTWACHQSALMPPNSGVMIESYTRFGLGIDKLFECLMFGITCGLIRKSGSWFYLDFVGEKDPPKAQGGEGAYQLLEENPEWAKKLEQEVFKMGTGLVKAAVDE